LQQAITLTASRRFETETCDAFEHEALWADVVAPEDAKACSMTPNVAPCAAKKTLGRKKSPSGKETNLNGHLNQTARLERNAMARQCRGTKITDGPLEERPWRWAITKHLCPYKDE